MITLNGPDIIHLDLNDTYSEMGAVAYDACDPSLPAVTVDSSAVDTEAYGEYAVTYNVTDSSSNAAAEVTRLVTVTSTDVSLPVISLNGPAVVYLDLNDTYNELGETGRSGCRGRWLWRWAAVDRWQREIEGVVEGWSVGGCRCVGQDAQPPVGPLVWSVDGGVGLALLKAHKSA